MMTHWRKTKESDRYEVNDNGDVRGPSGRILKPTLMQIGYYSAAISLGDFKTIRRYVHRLVADAFLGGTSKGSVVKHSIQCVQPCPPLPQFVSDTDSEAILIAAFHETIVKVFGHELQPW